MEGGKEQNFWPGFVDALSNVVLVMIFVVVVFVVTLFYYSQKLAQMKVSKIVAQSQSQTVEGNERTKSSARIETPAAKDTQASEVKAERDQAQEIDSLRREVAVLKAKLAAPPLQSDTGSLRSTLAPSSPNAIQVQTEPSKDKVAPGVQVQADARALTLNFDADSTQLSDDGTKAMARGLADWVNQAKAKHGKIVVTGVIDSAGYSDGRRRAYYRTVAVRNYLLDQGVDKDRVVSRVATSANESQSASSVVVQYQAGAK